MVVIKSYYANTEDFLICSGLSRENLVNLACEYNVALPGICFEYPRYTVPSILSHCEITEFLLYSGMYGTFPKPSTTPNMLSERDKLYLGLDGELWWSLYTRYRNESGIETGAEFTARAFLYNIRNPKLSYKELFSVVWFLLCLREELVKAIFYKRDLTYKPIIQFENPIYYYNGFAAPWVDTNNVVLACLYSILETTAHFLACTFFFNEVENYNFVCYNESLITEKTMPSFYCVNTEKSKRFLYSTAVRIFDMLEFYSSILKGNPLPNNSRTNFSAMSKLPLKSLIYKIFVKINRMENFVKSL